MSQEELRRVEVLARVRSKQLRVVDASRLLRVSYRQAKRLWKRYREEGACGPEASQRGASSNHAYRRKFRQRVLELVREKYGGPVGERFGPTLAAEHLARGRAAGECRDAATVDAGSRDCGAGSGSAEAPATAGAQRTFWGVGADGRQLSRVAGGARARGLLDRHGRRRHQHDAGRNWGSKRRSGRWRMRCGAWIEQYGVPLALYVDWKNLYKRAATPRERLRGEEPITQFGRMCAKLGIELIAASSPQAKGRSRADARHAPGPAGEEVAAEADRQSPSGECVSAEGISAGTQRAVRAGRPGPEDYHRRAPRAAELDRIFRSGERAGDQRRTGWCGTRIAISNWIGRVAMCRREARCWSVKDGRGITIEYRGHGLRWKQIEAPAKPAMVGPVSAYAEPNPSGCRRRITPGAKPFVVPRSGRLPETTVARPSLAVPSASP